MKLYGDFEAVRFPEENLIFITQNGYLYYIYNPKNEIWKKYRNFTDSSLAIINVFLSVYLSLEDQEP